MTALLVGLLAGWALVPRGRRSRPVDPCRGTDLARPGLAARWLRLARRDRAGPEVACLPELLELTARSMRAGVPIRASLVMAVDLAPASGLRSALARVDAGVSLGDALDSWSAGIDHPDAELVVAVLLLGETSGAAVAAQLDQTAARLRQRAALADEVRALTAQTRASATVVALAPVAFALVVAAADHRVVATMFGTTIGRLSVAAGLVLDGLGVWWMRRLTEVDA